VAAANQEDVSHEKWKQWKQWKSGHANSGRNT
jgi:hypothetical protein